MSEAPGKPFEIDTTQPAMDEDQALAYVQHARKGIIKELTKTGLPTERGDQAMLLAALDGISRDALGSKRIKADDKIANGLGDMAAVVGNMLNQISHQTGVTIVDENAAAKAPTLPDTVPPPELVPGETEQTPMQMDYDSFTNDFHSRNAGLPSLPPGLPEDFQS